MRIVAQALGRGFRDTLFSRTRRSNRGSTLISVRSAAEAAPIAYAGPCLAQLPISPLVGELGLAV